MSPSQDLLLTDFATFFLFSSSRLLGGKTHPGRAQGGRGQCCQRRVRRSRARCRSAAQPRREAAPTAFDRVSFSRAAFHGDVARRRIQISFLLFLLSESHCRCARLRLGFSKGLRYLAEGWIICSLSALSCHLFCFV